MDRLSWAKRQAVALIGRDDRRIAHVASVAARADELGAALLGDAPDDREVLVVSAWLHDVGYGELLVRTGCHHLDGAAYVRDLGEERLAALVAHHSSGAAEARLRGLEGELKAYEREESLVADLLTYGDLSTGPDGQRVSLSERLAEVARRYGPDHVVTEGLRASEDELARCFARVEALLAVQGG